MTEDSKALKFTKMHGAGNDYIYIDCFEKTPENLPELAIKLSDRHKGIGGDGIVLICRSDICDAKMRMFNADGSEGKMCGNAIRCVGKYLFDRKMINKSELTIETLSGIKRLSLHILEGKAIAATVMMGQTNFAPPSIPVLLDGESVINRRVKLMAGEFEITCVSVGNPHCVIFVGDTDSFDVDSTGKVIENDPIFPERVNVEFLQFIDDHTLKMRVWERGSGETLACGTGACASVAAAVKLGLCRADEDIRVLLRGGELVIRVTDEGIFMTGEAVEVFEGFLTI